MKHFIALRVFALSLLFSPWVGAQSTLYWDGAHADASAIGTGSSVSGGTWSTSVANWTTDVTSGDENWPDPSGVSDTASPIAVFGNSSTTNAGKAGITVSGTVNASGIMLAPGSDGNLGFTISGGTIHDGLGGTFTISDVGQFVNNTTMSNLNFTGASSYQFTGSSSKGTGNGPWLNGGVLFDNNVVLGTGSDYGTIGWGTGSGVTGNLALLTSSGTVTVNNGWSIFLYGGSNSTTGNGNVYNQSIILKSMGGFGGGGINSSGSINGIKFNGAIALQADSSITLNAGGAGNNQNNNLGGNISGSNNLYLGYNGTQSTTNTSLFFVGNGSTASTNSGAVILFNSTGGDNTNGNGIAGQAISLGQDNGISTAATIILGQTGGKAETSSIVSPNTNTPSGWTASDGALDLHGRNQSVKGILVGGVLQYSGTSSVLTQSKNLVFNGASGNSVLTIAGNTGLASGFGGTIEDNAGIGTGTVGLDVTTGGVLMLDGVNTYTGGTTVDGGLLEAGATTSQTTAGATAGSAGTATTGTFGASTGTLAVNKGGTVDLEGINETVGATTLGLASNSQGSTIQSTSSGVATLTTGGVTVNGTGNVIGSKASVTGGASLSGNSALLVHGKLDSATFAGTGATLSGDGNVGTTTLASGNFLSPGTTVGTSMTGTSLTFNGGAALDFTLSGTGVSATDTNLTLTGAFTKGTAGTFTINLAGDGAAASGTVFDLVNFGSTTFAYTDFSLGAGSPYSGTFSVTGTELAFTVGASATPEPSTWAMLLGGVAVLLVWQRRRLA